MNSIKRWYLKIFGGCENPSLSDQLEVARSKKKGLELECIRKNECPDCKTKGQILIGPSGGMCTNVRCGNCGSRFNTTPFSVKRL